MATTRWLDIIMHHIIQMVAVNCIFIVGGGSRDSHIRAVLNYLCRSQFCYINNLIIFHVKVLLSTFFRFPGCYVLKRI